LPETIAIVLELTRSPSVPSCGLFGTGAPARCACASPANVAAHKMPRKRQTDFHGRKTGLASPPMICPRATDLRQRNTPTRYAHPHCLTLFGAACPHRGLVRRDLPARRSRVEVSLDCDVCGLVWHDEGAREAFSPKLG